MKFLVERKADINAAGNGKLEDYHKLTEYICGKTAIPAPGEFFMKSLKGLTFPRGLRSIRPVAILGTGFGC